MNKQIANKMKMRAYWLSMAAVATVLVACTDDVVLRDDNQSQIDSPSAIGFSSYSEKGTRGDVTNPLFLEYYHGTFTVYGSKISTVDNSVSEVFDGGATSLVTFSDNATAPNEWTYSPYRYWDKQADYNFIAVAPDASIVNYNWDLSANPLSEVSAVSATGQDFVTAAAGYTLVGQNLQATATSAEITKGFVGGVDKDTDIMTSSLTSENGASHNPDVVLSFKHILAKLNVTVAKASVLNDADVYVKSLEITGLKDHGTYAESAYYYSVDSTHSGWTASVESAGYALSYIYANDANYDSTKDGFELEDYTTTTVSTYFIESLVMPQAVAADDATLVLKYQIVTKDGTSFHKEDYSYKLDMNSAFASYLDRHNYTLKLTISPEVITFDADAVVWDNVGEKDITIE